MNRVDITIGADPELFLIDIGSGLPISSIGLVGGTKSHPRILNEKSGLRVLEDNVTLEFNLNPHNNVDSFLNAIKKSTKYISDKIAYPLSARISTHDALEFNPAYLENIQARTSGCDPDFDAYKRGQMRMPRPLSLLGNWRCAGGHIHLGYNVAEASTPPWAIAQFLDVFATLFWDEHFSTETMVRRNYYGAPGIYRPKPYGIEYRTPNAKWIDFILNNRSVEFISDCQYTIASIMEDEYLARELYFAIDWEKVKAMLNSPVANPEVGKFRAEMRILRRKLFERGDEYFGILAHEKSQSGLVSRLTEI